MAIFHLSVKMTRRSAGQSAVAAAAYRSASRLFDERENTIHDYRGKSVEKAFIVAPDGAAWAQDRERLWNAAEAAERRKNSTLAREYEIAIPADLRTSEARLGVVREFAQELVNRYGSLWMPRWCGREDLGLRRGHRFDNTRDDLQTEIDFRGRPVLKRQSVVRSFDATHQVSDDVGEARISRCAVDEHSTEDDLAAGVEASRRLGVACLQRLEPGPSDLDPFFKACV